MPLYFIAGILSILPDTPWLGEGIANNGTDELRNIGYAILRTNHSPPRGLLNVEVRPSSYLELEADRDSTVEVYHCLRAIDFVGHYPASTPPTWNAYNGGTEGGPWQIPGGLGVDDTTYIGSLSLTAEQPQTLSSAALRSALQNMVDGAELNFLIRRADTGPPTIIVRGAVTIEFDLDSPPN